MSINRIKKIRYILTGIMGLSFFIGMQFITDTTGSEVSFFESLAIALLIVGLVLSMSSDWLYNALADDNIKINYVFFQVIGITIILLFIYTISITVYNEYY